MKTKILMAAACCFLLFMACDKNDEKDAPDDPVIQPSEPEPDPEEILANDPIYQALLKEKLESKEIPRPDDAYTYPIDRGTPEWWELFENLSGISIYNKMMEVCSIPEATLKQMSTHALIQALMDYPLVIDFYFSNSAMTGFWTYYSENTTYQELVTREDAGRLLLEWLLTLNPLDYPDELIVDLPGKDIHYLDICVLELMMGQPEFLSQLVDAERKNVVRSVLINESLWKELPDMPRRFMSNAISFWVAGNVMLYTDYAPFVDEVNNDDELKKFLVPSYTWVMVSPEFEQLIFSYAVNYLK